MPAKKSKTAPTNTASAADAKKRSAESAEPKAKRLSALDAAARVLEEATEPLNTKQMVEAMSAKGYWTSPGGKTPHATLYSAILREIGTKKDEARFRKTTKGHFAAAGQRSQAADEVKTTRRGRGKAVASAAPAATATEELT